MRDLLESWFRDYPNGNNKNALLGKFQSANDNDFDSAFFELFLHALLGELGCRVEIHPPVADQVRNRPDFLVKPPIGEAFYLEAKVATDTSSRTRGALKRLDDVFDYVDTYPSRDFFIGLNIHGLPNSPVPLRRIGSILEPFLKSLDPNEITLSYEQGNSTAIPERSFEHDGLTIDLMLLPRSEEARGRSGARSLGGTIMTDWSDPGKTIRKAIKKKATKYGNLDRPYVVAVNAAMWGVDQQSILDALFGTGSFVFTRPVKPGQRSQFQRQPDGIWKGSRKPTNTRVSAVWLFRKLSLWGLATASMWLCENPWAKKPLVLEFAQLPRAYADDAGNYVFGEGLSPGHILGIPAGWPEAAASE